MQLLIFLYQGLLLLSSFMYVAFLVLLFYNSVGYLVRVISTAKAVMNGRNGKAISLMLTLLLSIGLLLYSGDTHLMALGLMMGTLWCYNASETLTFTAKRKGFIAQMGAELLHALVAWPLRFAWLVILAELLLRYLESQVEDKTIMALWQQAAPAFTLLS